MISSSGAGYSLAEQLADDDAGGVAWLVSSSGALRLRAAFESPAMLAAPSWAFRRPPQSEPAAAGMGVTIAGTGECAAGGAVSGAACVFFVLIGKAWLHSGHFLVALPTSLLQSGHTLYPLRLAVVLAAGAGAGGTPRAAGAVPVGAGGLACAPLARAVAAATTASRGVCTGGTAPPEGWRRSCGGSTVGVKPCGSGRPHSLLARIIHSSASCTPPSIALSKTPYLSCSSSCHATTPSTSSSQREQLPSAFATWALPSSRRCVRNASLS